MTVSNECGTLTRLLVRVSDILEQDLEGRLVEKLLQFQLSPFDDVLRRRRLVQAIKGMNMPLPYSSAQQRHADRTLKSGTGEKSGRMRRTADSDREGEEHKRLIRNTQSDERSVCSSSACELLSSYVSFFCFFLLLLRRQMLI